jgi:hypothetical protein
MRRLIGRREKKLLEKHRDTVTTPVLNPAFQSMVAESAGSVNAQKGTLYGLKVLYEPLVGSTAVVE